MPTNFIKKAPGLMDRLQKDLGLSLIHSAAILGNIGHECGGFVLMQEVHPVAGKGGYGFCQWTGRRRTLFFAYCKKNNLSVDSDEGNYRYLLEELRDSESSAIVALKKQTTLKGAVTAFETYFERAGVPAIDSRVRWAEIALAAHDKAQPVKNADPIIAMAPVKPVEHVKAPQAPIPAPAPVSPPVATPEAPVATPQTSVASVSVMHKVLRFLHLVA